jgi:quercetin dioxygenase-like cupin family protein
MRRRSEMWAKRAGEVSLDEVQEGIGIRWLIAAEDGAPNFAMRVIEIEPGVVFEPHHHPYEHEIYVLAGQGIVSGPAGEAEMRPDTVLFVPADEPHGYRNTGDRTLKFVCVIPLQEE